MTYRAATTDHLIAAANTAQHHSVSPVILVLAVIVAFGVACVLWSIYWRVRTWAYYASRRASIFFHELTQKAGIALVIFLVGALAYYRWLA